MASSKDTKSILIVEDNLRFAQSLGNELVALSKGAASPYRFGTEIVGSTQAAVERLRAKAFDVVLLDVKLPGDSGGGLKLNLSLAMRDQFGPDKPVRIVITAEPQPHDSVEAVRNGAWDYIDKAAFSRNKSIEEFIFDSAVSGLRRNDLRDELRRAVNQWLPLHLDELQAKYGGQLIALWHEPAIQVLAHGRDAFDLAEALHTWRQDRPAWEDPFLLQVTPARDWVE